MISTPQFQAFCKAAADVPQEEKRPTVKGMKMPRLATPRLGAGKLPGGTPANPFRGNWQSLNQSS